MLRPYGDSPGGRPDGPMFRLAVALGAPGDRIGGCLRRAEPPVQAYEQAVRGEHLEPVVVSGVGPEEGPQWAPDGWESARSDEAAGGCVVGRRSVEPGVLARRRLGGGRSTIGSYGQSLCR
jgi:hypothetical protein